MQNKEEYLLKRDSYSSLQPTSKKIEVTDVTTNISTIYPSMTSASKSIGIRQPCISLYLKDKRTKPYKGKLIFKLVNANDNIDTNLIVKIVKHYSNNIAQDSINNKEKVSSVLPQYKNILNKFSVNSTKYDKSLFNPLDYIPKFFNILKTRSEILNRGSTSFACRFVYAVAVGSSVFIVYLPVFYSEQAKLVHFFIT